ncbi:MAG: hypothetical protein FWC26_03505 [Fibromonadales bacterium]|nr:hypothetical protein [Fibromonadales bacterium]
MLLAVIGSDEFGKEERIAEFWEKALADGSQRKVFFASEYMKDDSSLTADVAQALTPSFFGPAASVLVKHCEYMPAEEQRRLASFLPGFQGNLALDFIELDKRSVLWKFLEKQGEVALFTPPKYSDAIQKWVAGHVQKHFKIKIEPAATHYIADAIGGDTKRIHNEIKKILIYDSGIKEIKIEHCSLFIKQDREVPAYELQDPFGFRNFGVFLPRFRRIMAEQGNEAFMSVISTLRSHSLLLLHIQAMRSKKMQDYEIANRLLPPNKTFTYKKNDLPEQCYRWQPESLQKAILSLDELSYGIKTGRYSDLPSFELAICGLML